MTTRRLRFALAGLLTAAAAAFPLVRDPQTPAPRPQGEIGLSLGGAFSLASAEAAHRQSWTTGPAAGLSVRNDLAASPSASLFVGGSYSRFFGRGLGILAGFGYAKNGIAASSGFASAGSAAAVSRRLAASPDPSEITAVPLYIGLAARWTGRRSSLVFSAGPALILHSIVVETDAGTLAAAASGAAAAFAARAAVPDQTWIAAGLHAGLTADLPISVTSALFFELRYIYSPRRSFAWEWRTGTLAGLDDAGLTASFDAAAAQAASAATRPLTVDPSLLHVSAGLRVRLH